jgi:hypothetical protein
MQERSVRLSKAYWKSSGHYESLLAFKLSWKGMVFVAVVTTTTFQTFESELPVEYYDC